jgi:hypothetical protein
MPQPSEAAVREETVRIPGPINGLKLGLRHATALSLTQATPQRAVLVLHGSGVPVSGNPDYHFAGQSLMMALAETGLDVHLSRRGVAAEVPETGSFAAARGDRARQSYWIMEFRRVASESARTRT